MQPSNSAYKLIALTRGLVTKVDEDDFDRLNKHSWTVHADNSRPFTVFYVVRGSWITDPENPLRQKRAQIYMHREVMNCPDDKEVDHVLGDTLDNRKSKLKVVTHEENMNNTIITRALAA